MFPGHVFVVTLLFLLCNPCTTFGEPGTNTDVQKLEERAKLLEHYLATNQLKALGVTELDVLIDLGATLQTLNHLRPDGGKRIAKAEMLYR